VVLLGEVVLGGVLVGDVPTGLVLPGAHGGFATVAEVPAGLDEFADATVLELPVLVDGVAVLGEVEAVVLPVLVLLEGVHGATVELVPVVPPVTDPAWPATPGVPCVTEGEPVEVVPGCDVCRVPMDPVVPDVVVPDVEVVPEGVDVVPCGVEVVPG
jgi:hypothetical protein